MVCNARHMLSIDLLGGGQREAARTEISGLIYEAMEMVPYYAQDRMCPVEYDHEKMQPTISALFGEISTRTFGSSMAAARKVGLAVGDPVMPGQSSLGKGETWTNTARMIVQQGSQMLVIRSKIEGLGLHLAQCLERTATEEDWVRRGTSIVIGGAGTRDHPTQVLLDLTTIVLRKFGIRRMDDWPKIDQVLASMSRQDLQARICEILDNLKMAFVGDLRHSRVVHDWIHLARWFTICYTLIAPDILQVEPWCVEGPNFVTGHKLNEVLGADFLYSIRIQLSRLGENVPEHEARRVVRSLQITSEFLKSFPGEVMDAQPIDNDNPAIAADIQGHSKVIMRMQSAIGIPLRMAVIRCCFRNRYQEFRPLERVAFQLQADRDVLKHQPLATHWAELGQKYLDRKMFFTKVENGTVIDRIPPGGAQIINAVNRRAGLYRQGRGQRGTEEEVFSTSMGEKEVILLHNRWPDLDLAAVYGLIFPTIRLSWMEAERGDWGYQRLQLRLPEMVVGLFRCVNGDCITNHDPECKTHFRVMGHRGNAGVKCSYCQHYYSANDLVKGGMIA